MLSDKIEQLEKEHKYYIIGNNNSNAKISSKRTLESSIQKKEKCIIDEKEIKIKTHTTKVDDNNKSEDFYSVNEIISEREVNETKNEIVVNQSDEHTIVSNNSNPIANLLYPYADKKESFPKIKYTFNCRIKFKLDNISKKDIYLGCQECKRSKCTFKLPKEHFYKLKALICDSCNEQVVTIFKSGEKLLGMNANKYNEYLTNDMNAIRKKMEECSKIDYIVTIGVMKTESYDVAFILEDLEEINMSSIV